MAEPIARPEWWPEGEAWPPEDGVWFLHPDGYYAEWSEELGDFIPLSNAEVAARQAEESGTAPGEADDGQGAVTARPGKPLLTSEEAQGGVPAGNFADDDIEFVKKQVGEKPAWWQGAWPPIKYSGGIPIFDQAVFNATLKQIGPQAQKPSGAYRTRKDAESAIDTMGLADYQAKYDSESGLFFLVPTPPEAKVPGGAYRSLDEAVRGIENRGLDGYVPQYDPQSGMFFLVPESEAPLSDDFGKNLDAAIASAFASGDWGAGLMLDDIRRNPGHRGQVLQRYLDMALQVAESPADYLTVVGMMRGELPIQAREGTFGRIAGSFGASGTLTAFGAPGTLTSFGAQPQGQEPSAQSTGGGFLSGFSPEALNRALEFANQNAIKEGRLPGPAPTLGSVVAPGSILAGNETPFEAGNPPQRPPSFLDNPFLQPGDRLAMEQALAQGQTPASFQPRDFALKDLQRMGQRASPGQLGGGPGEESFLARGPGPTQSEVSPGVFASPAGITVGATPEQRALSRAVGSGAITTAGRGAGGFTSGQPSFAGGFPSYLRQALGQDVLSGGIVQPRKPLTELGALRFRSGQAQQRMTPTENEFFLQGLRHQGISGSLLDTYLQQEREATQFTPLPRRGRFRAPVFTAQTR